MNLRAGWLRIDAFDRTGRLVHRLTEPDHAWDASFFPQDLAVRSRADGTYIIAVAVSSPIRSCVCTVGDPPSDTIPGKPDEETDCGDAASKYIARIHCPDTLPGTNFRRRTTAAKALPDRNSDFYP